VKVSVTIPVLITALLGVSLLAQAPPTTGSISGRVIDADTKLPLGGVQVGSRETGRVATDADGRYVLRNVAAGPASVWVQETNGGYTNMTLTPPRKVVVAGGRETSGVDFRTRLDARISGRVVDENGEPLQGIRVSFIERTYPDGRTVFGPGELSARFLRTVVTDDRGAYELSDNIFAGHRYYILAQEPKLYASALSDVPVDPGSRRRVLVPTYYPNASSLETAVAVVPRSLEHRSDVNIRMRRAPNLCLEATLNAGATPSRMRFGIQDEQVPVESPQASGVPPLGGESGDNGRIRVCGLYPGRFRILTGQPTASNAVTAFVGEMPVTITNVDLSGLNVTTRPPVTVFGEVAWDKPLADVSRNPIVRMRFNPGFIGPSTQASIPGEFSFPALPTMAYSLSVFPQAQPGLVLTPDASLYVKDITYGGTSVLYGGIRPGDGSSRLRVVVGNDAGSIGITAARVDGKPAQFAAILLLPAIARTEAELAATLRSAMTDESGSSQIATVPPGLYYVLATDDPPLSRTLLPTGILEIEKTPETLALLLRVRSGGQLVEIGPGATVQVRVTPKALD
jgi:hypothetical protein